MFNIDKNYLNFFSKFLKFSENENKFTIKNANFFYENSEKEIYL